MATLSRTTRLATKLPQHLRSHPSRRILHQVRLSSTTPSPASECPCTSLPPTPSLPTTHPIDLSAPLENTTPLYHSHILLSSSKSDWSSKIDLDTSIHGSTISALRQAIKTHESALSAAITPLDRKTLLGMSSFAAPADPGTGRVVLFPNGQILDFKLRSEEEHNVAETALSTESEGPSHSVRRVKGITILLCSHGGRDVRCGILGPYLQECISKIISENVTLSAKFRLVDDPASTGIKNDDQDQEEEEDARTPVAVGLTSHIGGHKWAGNAIFYYPAGEKVRGLWYGRMNGENVEKVLVETLMGLTVGGGEEWIDRTLCRRVVY